MSPSSEAGPDAPAPTRPPDPRLPGPLVRRAAERALLEDLGSGDVTTDLAVGERARAAGRVVVREAGVVAGLDVCRTVFAEVDPALRTEEAARDGDRVGPGTEIAVVRGRARSILRAERVALNFLQRLGGVATHTSRFVAAVEGTGVRIVDTRKTTPGLRALEKYAVRCGGGANHRFGLSDAFLLKDNHRACLEAGGGSLGEVLGAARRRLPHTVRLEVEVDRPEQVTAAVEAGADAILLDNFGPGELERAVDEVDGRALLEASGGITLETVRDVAETGVDLISVGALTHSAPALDVALELEPA